MKIIKTLAVMAAVALGTGSVPAQSMVIDFESANPFSNGALSSNYALTGSQSLMLGNRVVANYDIPAEYLGQHLSITMNVLDLGKWTTGSVSGPHWGISTGGHTGAETAAAGLIQRTWAPSEAGYVTNLADYNVAALDWWGVNFWTGSNRATLADTASASGAIVISDTPAWTSWTFVVSPTGSVTGSTSEAPGDVTWEIGSSATRISFQGGKTDTLDTIYVDDITISVVPEPGTYALALGALGLLVVLIRRRQR